MEKQELEVLVKEGLSTYQIARRVGIGQTSVRYWLRKYKLKTKGLYKRSGSRSVIDVNADKICKKCGVLKHSSDFYNVKRNNSILKYSYCISCSKVEHKKNDKRPLYKLELLKLAGGKCCICGYDKCSSALEFHHINPQDKDFSISTFMIRSKGTLELALGEIKKCVLLCSNCHREFHAGLIKL